MKWPFSLLAFLLTGLAMSALTTHSFLAAADADFGIVKTTLDSKIPVLVDEAVKQTYAEMNVQQKDQIKQLDSLTASQRKQVIGTQCNDPQLKDQAFCNPRFISGQASFDTILRETVQTQLREALTQAFDDLKAKLNSYEKYSLLLTGSILLVLGAIVYVLTYGLIPGIQTFAGYVSWFGVLSAISFNLMPRFIDWLLSIMQQGTGATIPASVTKDIALAWLVPAMNTAFWFSFWFAFVSGIVWLVLKLFRNYDVSVS